tara:strand:+ start:71 stop:394 length:324 start_codon:yes stop_codon:yes gene_type:complete
VLAQYKQVKMEYGLYHITSATTTTLIDSERNRGSINSISICNQHASDQIKVDLYLDDGTNQSYIIKNVVIYQGTTLVLDHNISFDNSVLALKLTTTGTGLPVSVIVK